MEPGTLPNPKHVQFQWRWEADKEKKEEEEEVKAKEEEGQCKVVNFFDPSDDILHASVMTSEELKAIKAKAVVSSSNDPIANSEEEGWYWAVTGIRNGTTGPLALFASLSLK